MLVIIILSQKRCLLFIDINKQSHTFFQCSKRLVMKYTFLFLALSMLFACSSSKVQTDNSTNGAQYSESDSDNVYALRVSFFSIGSGIDRKTRLQYEQFIKEFEQKNKVSILLDTTTWGKEGEIDFCIKLTGLSIELQQQFIQSTKDKTKDSKLVRLYENTVCKYKK